MNGFKLLITILLLSTLLHVSSIAREVETVVKYISSESIYLDAGKIHGIAKGDIGEIKRDNRVIASIEVVFVADNSSSCTVLESSDEIRIGDIAVIVVKDDAILEQEEITITEKNVITKEPIKPQFKQEQTNRLSGRIGVQYYFQDDQNDHNIDIKQPSLKIKSRINNLLGTNHQLNVNFRIRRNTRNSHDPENTATDWNNRIYEVSLSYVDPANPFQYKAGRILSNRISGIGRIDGALLDYRVNEQFAAGLFGGTQPDFATSNISTDETKTGVYLNYQTDLQENADLGCTIALAGRYRNSEISKEFIYEQINFSYFRKLYLYQSSEIGVNRSWRKEVSESSLQLSNLLLNARYSFSRAFSINAGYDNNTLTRTYETRDTPDSLFDDSQRQGFRTGFNLLLPYKIYTNARVGLRLRDSDNSSTRTLSYGIGRRNLFSSGVGINLNLNIFDNPSTTGAQPFIQISKMFFRQLNTVVIVGQNQYSLNNYNEQVVHNWLKTEFDYYFAGPYSVSVYSEIYRGDNFNTNRYFIELNVKY
ncbi:hypothetical protein ACFLQJ_01445 [Calditrichota bacterium]